MGRKYVHFNLNVSCRQFRLICFCSNEAALWAFFLTLWLLSKDKWESVTQNFHFLLLKKHKKQNITRCVWEDKLIEHESQCWVSVQRRGGKSFTERHQLIHYVWCKGFLSFHWFLVISIKTSCRNRSVNDYRALCLWCHWTLVCGWM